jgi:hypothetical protein
MMQNIHQGTVYNNPVSIALAQSPYTVPVGISEVNVTTTGGNVRVNLPNTARKIVVNKVTDDSYLVTLFVSGTQIGEIAGYQSSVTIESGQITKDEPWYPYDAIVSIAGVSGDGGEVIAKNKYGRVIAGGRGVAGTDDISILHAARDFVFALGGGVVRTRGDFIANDRFRMASGVYFDGGCASKITLAAPLDKELVYAYEVHDCGIIGFEVDGAKATQGSFVRDAVHFSNCYNFLIEKNDIHDPSKNCINIVGENTYDGRALYNHCHDSANDGIVIWYASKNLVQGNWIQDVVNNNIHVYSAAHQNRILGNHCIAGTGTFGLYIVLKIGSSQGPSWAPSYGNIVEGNQVETTARAGIGIGIRMFSHGNIIKGNTVIQRNYVAYGSGISSQVDSTLGYTQFAPHDNIIEGNMIICDFNDEGSGVSHRGIALSSVRDLVKGNVIKGNSHLGEGIILSYANPDAQGYPVHNGFNVVDGNVISAPKKYGINIVTPFTKATHNRVFKAPSGGAGFFVYGSNIELTENDLINCVTGIRLYGTVARTGIKLFHNNIRSGVEEMITTLTANADSGQTTLLVYDPAIFDIGDIVHISDDTTPAGEDLIVATIEPSGANGRKITVTTNLVNSYTTAANPIIAVKDVVSSCLSIDSGYDYGFVDLNDFRDGVIVNSGGANTRFWKNYGYLTDNTGSSTGTGSEQTIAHGVKGVTTANSIATIEIPSIGYKGACTFDATNIKPRVKSGLAFNWTLERVV